MIRPKLMKLNNFKDPSVIVKDICISRLQRVFVVDVSTGPLVHDVYRLSRKNSVLSFSRLDDAFDIACTILAFDNERKDRNITVSFFC